jgi:ABC-type transport system substrate-binding protein
METTWRLKAGAVWHDGTALSAQDYVLGWRVYTTPELGQANTAPFNVLDDVSAPDDRTIVLRWKSLYPGAATMYEHNREFPALPRHLIEGSFQQMSPDAFLNLPYWTTEYVGLGPFHLDRWEMGQFLEASAFEQHVLGAPKISRLRIAFMADNNAVIASLLAGDILLTGDAAARLSSVPVLKESWVASGAGVVNLHFNQYRRSSCSFDRSTWSRRRCSMPESEAPCSTLSTDRPSATPCMEARRPLVISLSRP